MPDSLDRLNWGALLVPLLWALGHGIWGWVGILLAARALALAVGGLVTQQFGQATVPHIAASAVLSLAWWALHLSFALRANRLYWHRETRRVERQSQQSVPRWPVAVDAFVRNQRAWVIGGLAVYLLVIAASLPEPTVLARRAWIVYAFWLQVGIDVIVLANVYFWDTRRRSRAS